MKRIATLALACLAVTALGCYHATMVETGLTPSTQTVEKSFAAGWLFGLVGPNIETNKCPHGIAKAETQVSFVNQLVAWLTLDIYTPMNVKLTCAEGGRASLPANAPIIDVGANATPEELQSALNRAAEMSIRMSTPVYVEY